MSPGEFFDLIGRGVAATGRGLGKAAVGVYHASDSYHARQAQNAQLEFQRQTINERMQDRLDREKQTQFENTRQQQLDEDRQQQEGFNQNLMAGQLEGQGILRRPGMAPTIPGTPGAGGFSGGAGPSSGTDEMGNALPSIGGGVAPSIGVGGASPSGGELPAPAPLMEQPQLLTRSGQGYIFSTPQEMAQQQGQVAGIKNQATEQARQQTFQSAAQTAKTAFPNAYKSDPDSFDQAAMYGMIGMKPPQETLQNVLGAAASDVVNEEDPIKRADKIKTFQALHSSGAGAGGVLGQLAQDPTAGLGQAALDREARKYNLTGGETVAGFGNAAQRVAVSKRAAEMEPDLDLGTQKVAYAGNKKASDDLMARYSQLTSFEDTARNNLELANGLLQKVPDTGVPWLNTPLRELNQRAVGDVNWPAAQAALRVANNEIATLTNNATLKGITTDQSRKDIERIIPKDATLAQIKSVIPVLLADIDNRKGGLERAMSASVKRVGQGAAGIINMPVTPPQTTPVTRPEVGGGGGKTMTPELVQQYFQKYGSKAAAQAAARKDGYTF